MPVDFKRNLNLISMDFEELIFSFKNIKFHFEIS